MKNNRLLIPKIFVIFLFIILVLTSCVNNKEVKKQEKNPSFEYLNAFGGALFDIFGRAFPLKDGTFYIVVETHSPASTGDIPKSCHFKIHDLPNISDSFDLEDCGDIWIFQIDPRKEEGKQIVYSRCFGGTKGERIQSVIMTEDEQIVVCGIADSDDGDLSNEPVKGSKRWIFRVDPKKKWNEQITYSNIFSPSDIDEVDDIKFVSKDIAYIYSHRKSNSGYFYNLKAIDFSKDRDNSQIFNRDIFFSDIKLIRDSSIYTKNKMVVGDNGILTIVVSADKDHLFMPKDKNKALNINKTISYKDNKSEDDKKIKNSENLSDILVLSLDPKLSESDWIVFSRFIGGNNIESTPSILKAKDGKYWISFRSNSHDGELKGVPFKNYSNLVLLKLNPNLAFDKQIEYLKYFSTINKDEHLGLYYFAKDENDNLAFLSPRVNNLTFLFQKVNRTNAKDDKNAILDNETYDKEKNVVFPPLKKKTDQNIFEIFYLDTKKDEVFYKDLYIFGSDCCLDFCDTSSLVFAISANNKPNVGDMPNYKMSILENLGDWVNKNSSSDATVYSNILVGILSIKDMKKLEK